MISKLSPFSSISNLAWIKSPSISVQGSPICSCRDLPSFCQVEFKHDGAARRAVFWPEPACRAVAAGRARRDLRGWYRRRRPRPPTSQYRLHHNRKDKRIHSTMSDLLGYLLVASDPLLSSLGLQLRRRLYWSRYGQLQPQTLGLRVLAEPRPHAAVVAEDADDGADSSDSSDDDNDDFSGSEWSQSWYNSWLGEYGNRTLR